MLFYSLSVSLPLSLPLPLSPPLPPSLPPSFYDCFLIYITLTITIATIIFFQVVPLNLACAGGHLDAVKQLTDLDVDLLARDHRGWNCMDYAADGGNEYVRLDEVVLLNLPL